MALISLAGIAEAIDNLNISEATLKGKLLTVIRSRFDDEESLDTVTAIDSLELIKELWGPQTTSEIKAKRKNLSSLKSTINKSLKDGITTGVNPEGIIIGRDNVFIIADEKKNLLLDKLSLSGDGTPSLLSALAAINEMLSGIEAPTDKDAALKILEQLDATRKNLTKMAGLPEEGSGEGSSSGQGEGGGQMLVEEFEVDDDTVIEFIDEEIIDDEETDHTPILQAEGPSADDSQEHLILSPEDGDKGSAGNQELSDLSGASESESSAGLGSAGQDQGTGALAEDIGHAGPASSIEEDWDSYEIVEDIEILDEELDDTAVEQFGDDELEEDFADEAAEDDIVATSPDHGSGGDQGQAEPEGAEGGGSPAEEAADDWDSFEVIDDDLDSVDSDDLEADTDETSEPDAGELEALETAKDELIEEVEDDELEEDFADEAAEDIVAASPALGSGGDQGQAEPEAAEGGGSPVEEPANDWDSFEVIDDDLDIVDSDNLEADAEEATEPDAEELEILNEDLEALETAGDEPSEEVGDENLTEDFEEISEEDLSEQTPDSEQVDQEDLEEIEATDDGVETGSEPLDDWDSFEIVDDDVDFSQPSTGQQESPSTPPRPPLDRSLDISQYIEPEEALLYIPEILQEHNDEYIRQILERFMPKFIKIPANTYTVGDKKKRQTDRSAGHVSLPEFYIGQLPITNDLFDFFVRATGYETDAERQGHGLVTSGRLRRDLKQQTGRHTLAINKGIITRQVKGANWRHPDGPGSSLENRSHHPVVQVSRQDAMAFASWAGKRLPREDEWEAAARGREGFLLPWGNDFLPLANLEGQQVGTTTAVNYFGKKSLSPFGLLDMLGNVYEWTSSTYNSQNGRELYILKGGSWATARITCADRLIEPATTWSNTIGFRCAVDAT